MKTSAIFAASAAILLFAACNSSNEGNTVTTQSDPATQAANDSLRQALEERDQMLALVGDIQSDLDQIKSLEKILITVDGTESSYNPDKIKSDIEAIKLSIMERQKQLADLEARLGSAGMENANLRKAVAAMREQIASQVETINSLRGELAKANIHIDEMTQQLEDVNLDLQQTVAERDQVVEENTKLVDDMNVCYIAVGSKDELKKNKIIETGFLKKTKIMPEDFEQSYFTKYDKRTLTTLPLYSKKAEIKTNQPKDSYTLAKDADGQYVLTITNPTEFWKTSNYVVIQIN